MKSRLWLLPAFLLLAFAPGVAAAQSNDGFYASVSGFYVLPTESSTSYTEGDLKLTGDIPLDSGPGFALAVGHGTSNGLRGEIELAYRSSSWDKYENLDLTFDGDSIASGDLEIGGDLKTLSLMANGIVAFDASWGLRPYLGAGLGFAQHDVTTDAFTLTVDGNTHEFASSSSDDTVFAWQVMFGLTYPVSDSAEARFGYRYFATGEADFDGTKADYGSHNLEIGLLFRL